ncbi:MAG: hypothetical protein ACI9W2_000449 [Gammaproteobacteria bacterium]|jgi:hypothetical protein
MDRVRDEVLELNQFVNGAGGSVKSTFSGPIYGDKGRLQIRESTG